MPVDQKRINGPDASTSYDIYTYSETKDNGIQRNVLKRHDDRSDNELRNIFLKTGIVSQAKGSAYIEMGDTKVICSVFDPREIPNKTGFCMQGELFCEFKFASFSHRKRKLHQQDAEEKEYSLILRRALEPAVCLQEFPNFQVDVYATVLDNGGSALAAAIMAASLALANAGVPMFGLVIASTIGICNGTYLVDPTDIEETFCSTKAASDMTNDHGIVVQAALPQHGQISEMFVIGSINMHTMEHSMGLLSKAHKDICPLLEQCLVKTVFSTFRSSSKKTNK
ncbi:Exosome complex exonuclease MTR3 [Trachymyrmex zeteki]|uniref:Exosome complex exonuclease MTR3 n=1 Tax=Mycetomoellerius zeteki TaxID=64791 RepID=A0A151XKI5_9HYME|nr:PREDICTED: exosome complex component MTR3-like [Trachymyrmex zeteki]KYQ60798.1 Exosome complex exonuclease MTR3 [Trachymyrmex zeteki]